MAVALGQGAHVVDAVVFEAVRVRRRVARGGADPRPVGDDVLAVGGVPPRGVRPAKEARKRDDERRQCAQEEVARASRRGARDGRNLERRSFGRLRHDGSNESQAHAFLSWTAEEDR